MPEKREGARKRGEGQKKKRLGSVCPAARMDIAGSLRQRSGSVRVLVRRAAPPWKQ